MAARADLTTVSRNSRDGQTKPDDCAAAAKRAGMRLAEHHPEAASIPLEEWAPFAA